MKKGRISLFATALLLGCVPEKVADPVVETQPVLPVFPSQGLGPSESVFPDGSSTFSLSHPVPAPGPLRSLSDLHDGFWKERGLPKGGARIHQGLALWIEQPQPGSDVRRLQAWDGSREYTLISSEGWPWPFFLISRKTDAAVIYVYCCIGFGLGCFAGPGFFLDLASGQASMTSDKAMESDFRAFDFPTGQGVQYQDEVWFDFRDGRFLARVTGPQGLVIASDEGTILRPLFPATAAGATGGVIGDGLLVNPEGNIVYFNSLVNYNPASGLGSEVLWEAVLQDGISGKILLRRVLPYELWLLNSAKLGLETERLRGLRLPRFDTSWQPTMGKLDEMEYVLVLRIDASAAQVQSPRLGVLDVTSDRVSFIDPAGQ